MPQRSLLSRQSHTHSHAHSNPNAASKSRQGTGTMALKGRNTNATMLAPTGGRKERVNTTRRVCSSNWCMNALDPGWPWKRCKQCLKGSKGGEGRKAKNPYMPVVSAAFVLYTAYTAHSVLHPAGLNPLRPVLKPCSLSSAMSSHQVYKGWCLDPGRRGVLRPCPSRGPR